MSEPCAAPPPQSHNKKNIIRKLYDWTLSWAETKFALPALCFLSFIESSVFPIPPDPLLSALCFGKPKKGLIFALWCTVASVLGGVLGYYIGFAFYELVGKLIVEFYHKEDVFLSLQDTFKNHGFMAILVAAVSPIPYKVFTIAAGVAHLDLITLIVASVIGRGARFFFQAILIFFFGNSIKKYLEKYLEIALIVMLILGVLGFYAITLIKH
ncbi:MAG: YqaA family protein [Verrucomicrobiota bacterium]